MDSAVQQKTVVMDSPEDIALADKMNVAKQKIIGELSKLIVGQEQVVHQVLLTLFVGGNSLIVGVPGLAKTLLIRTLAQVLDLKFNRIQFTPDLMPSDITGTDIIQEDSATGRRQMVFAPGPIFANIVLADEINRTPPKTQSALLEAMQDVSVSVGKTTYRLEQPFLVLATQNPLEMEGTYPLPEAQLDRFFFKLKVTYPSEEAMHGILDRTTQDANLEVNRVLDGAEILQMRHVARAVPIARPVQAYAIRLTLASHPGSQYATALVNRYVRYGASPRAAQALVLAAKIHALVRGQAFVAVDDIRSAALPALRHRLLLNFEGEADEVSTDTIVEEMLSQVSGA